MLFQFEAISSLAKCQEIFKTLKPKKSHPIFSIHFLSIWANNVTGAYNCTCLQRFVFFWLRRDLRGCHNLRGCQNPRGGIPLMDSGCLNRLHTHTHTHSHTTTQLLFMHTHTHQRKGERALAIAIAIARVHEL